MKRLVKSEIDARISEMWAAIPGMPEEDKARHTVVEDALKVQAVLYKTYELQEKALDAIWELCNRLNTNPFTGVLHVVDEMTRQIDAKQKA